MLNFKNCIDHLAHLKELKKKIKMPLLKKVLIDLKLKEYASLHQEGYTRISTELNIMCFVSGTTQIILLRSDDIW